MGWHGMFGGQILVPLGQVTLDLYSAAYAIDHATERGHDRVAFEWWAESIGIATPNRLVPIR